MTLTDAPRSDESPVVELAAIYDAHGASAYALARRITRDRDLAAEAVQEAFLSLWRERASYQPERGEIGPWIRTFVHRRAVDLVRRNAARPLTKPLDSAADEVPAQGRGPEDEAVRADEACRVRAALEGLPLAKRQLLLLAYFHGYSQREIASLLRVPVGTVKSRTFAAMRELRLRLPSEDTFTRAFEAADD